MEKIQRVSRLLQHIFLLILITLPICFLYNHLDQRQAYFPLSTPNGFLQLPLDIRLRVIKGLLDLGPLVIQAFIVICLIRIFSLFKSGKVFVSTNIQYMRLIGIAIILKELCGPFIQIVMTNLATLHTKNIQHQCMISLTTTQLSNILTGLILILISWIMLEACNLKEDNELIC